MLKLTPSSTLSTRVRTLERGLNRLAKLLEAENTALREFSSLRFDKRGRDVKVGANLLLSSKERILPTIIEPYDHVFKDVWIGFEKLPSYNNWATIGFEPAGESTSSNGPVTRYAPKFFVHPVFASTNTTRWVTIETKVDKSLVTPDVTLSLDVVANFEFNDPREAWHTNTVRMTLRGTRSDGTYIDNEIGVFPVTTVPIAHTLMAKVEALRDVIKEVDGRLSLILWLPTHGAYRFNLYGISAEVV